MSAASATDSVAMLYQADEFVAQVCEQFTAQGEDAHGGAAVELAQTAVYHALGWWLQSPVIVSPLCDGLLTLARARVGEAGAVGALERARTRLGQAKFYLPRHLIDPVPESPNP
jgi:hypothetical protein